ncbi:MAG: hypothetical protein H5T86_06500 [Armatimonadetes bacterium]|nr:hypothetical protein [Armatimonadota bacterium]
METKKQTEVLETLRRAWPGFSDRRRSIVAQVESGRRLSERDVEQILEALLQGPLGWDLTQVARQQDFADFALIDRGLKLAVIETKGFDAFSSQAALDDALIQGARYADRHRTPVIWAFDGCRLVLASRDQPGEAINVHIEARMDAPEPPEEVFYFTHYGLFRYPTQVVRSIHYSSADDQALYKRHHGELLHYSCFAYVGDLRDKQTWMMPYRNADGSVDTTRIGHAVNFLLSPGGYRGQKASRERIPEAATLLCALRLARAYKEIGRWRRPERPFSGGEKPDPQTLLWLYLHQHGIEDPGDII